MYLVMGSGNTRNEVKMPGYVPKNTRVFFGYIPEPASLIKKESASVMIWNMIATLVDIIWEIIFQMTNVIVIPMVISAM